MGGGLVIVCVMAVCVSVCLAGGWALSESGGCSVTYTVSLYRNLDLPDSDLLVDLQSCSD